MRSLLLASFALLLSAASSMPGAFAQNAAGNPKSGAASNIDSADTRSAIAPALPTPGSTGTAEEYLHRAQLALRASRTGEAQEALERAETRLLDRSTAPAAAGQPDTSPRVDAVRQALMALAHRNRAGAMSAIETAMASPARPDDAMPMPATTGAMAPGEPMGTVPAPASAGPASVGGSGVPTSANGVAVNPRGGSSPGAGNQSGSPAP